LRRITQHVYQGGFQDALSFNGKLVSVARECAKDPEVHVPLQDGVYIDFWDYVRVVSYLHVRDVQGVNTMVHCCVGASRSVYMAAAYLIWRGHTAESAFQAMGVDPSVQQKFGGPMWTSLKDYERRVRDPLLYRFLNYMLIQFEALQNDSPVPEDRVQTVKKYVSNGSKVLILGCTSPEYEIFSKLYGVECIHLNALGKVGKFMMFEYNDYPDNTFDAVLAFDTLEHMYAPFITIGEIRRILKNEGIFYHSTPTISDSMKIPWHVSLFSVDVWKWLFDWWDFKVLEEKADPGRITQVLRKEKYTKFESYHKLIGIF